MYVDSEVQSILKLETWQIWKLSVLEKGFP